MNAIGSPTVHIGLIGGIGPAATEFYYRHLVHAYSSRDRVLELTIVHSDLRRLLDNMANDAPGEQAQEFLRFAERLEAAGAAILAITSIAGHFCVSEFEPISPVPIINVIPELKAELARRKLRRVGLLGTRVVMSSRLYGGLSGTEVVLPQGDSFKATHDEYVALAAAGEATAQQRERLFSIGLDLCRTQGAEAVILAGTDLFLAFQGHECGFPVIDSAEVHIEAIVRASMTTMS
jgi:aspartate racemase